jgi:hypothetical protein
MDSTPRCYVLDEEYRLILACAVSPEDPLASLYDAQAEPDSLPADIARVVRALTQSWERESEPVSASAIVNRLHVTVSPLTGPAGRHIAVFVKDRGHDAPMPIWGYEASA